MAFTAYHNLTGSTGVFPELLAPGDNVNVSKISLTNTQKVSSCKVDLYIEKALKGNNRSAEILLDWVRKVITDGGFLSRMQPVNDISEVMHSVEKSTSNLLELAKTLKDQPTFSKVEEAQYSESDPDKEPEG